VLYYSMGRANVRREAGFFARCARLAGAGCSGHDIVSFALYRGRAGGELPVIRRTIWGRCNTVFYIKLFFIISLYRP